VLFTVSIPKKLDCSVYQTGASDFGHLVLKWILCESTSRGSSGC
jgi:hypothetical protein